MDFEPLKYCLVKNDLQKKDLNVWCFATPSSCRLKMAASDEDLAMDTSSSYPGNDTYFANMDQLYQQVCMMSGGPGAESSREEGVIKQEEDRFCALPDARDLSTNRGASGGQPSSCASPSTTVLYSPSTTALTSELEYGDCVDDLGSSPRQVKRYRELPSSPSSPERQFCSSTTSTDPLLPSPEGLKEEDAPKRLCLVCGDIASGFHYGVASCEACKAFFKRTIQGNIEYNCPATNDCEINKRRRKACQACRFHKCLRVGMLKEGVRLDRVRGGRQKYRRTSESPFALSQLPIKKTSLDEIKLLTDLQNCEPELLLTLPESIHGEPEVVTLSTLADLYDRELVNTIGWAKLIPGFTALALNDQMRLLQSTWGEILTLSLAFRSIPSSGRLLRYALNFSLDETSARECNAQDLFTQIMGVVERLEQCSILKEEYLLLKALVLTNSDVRVQDTQALFRLRQSILQAIHDAVPSLRPRDATSHMQSLLLCLPSLRAADTCLRRFWHSVRQDGKVALKKLFLEMLDTHIR